MNNSLKNYSCDGDHCRDPHGEVRVYPLGGGANLIMCRACFANENRYRMDRGRAPGMNPADWPQIDWATATVYKSADVSRNDGDTPAAPFGTKSAATPSLRAKVKAAMKADDYGKPGGRVTRLPVTYGQDRTLPKPRLVSTEAAGYDVGNELEVFLKAVDDLLDDEVWEDVADKARKPSENGTGPASTLLKLDRVRKLRKVM